MHETGVSRGITVQGFEIRGNSATPFPEKKMASRRQQKLPHLFGGTGPSWMILK